MIRSQRGPKGAPRRRKGGTSEHDRGYKLLFSHPRLVEELIRGFLPGSWLDQLDFANLQKVSGSVITDDLRERHDDVIWKIRWKDGGKERWIYLLLELQSTPDRFMAVRMLTYDGLLLQELIREKKLEPGDLLPLILPVLFYHGKPPWSPSLDLIRLFGPAPEEVKDHLPHLRYRLLEVSRLPLHEPALRGNLVAALLRLEIAEAREAASRVREINFLIPAEEKELRRIINIWLVHLFRRFPFSATISKAEIHLGGATMLEETFREFEQKVRQEGRQEGLQKGLQKGRKEGLRDGLREGQVKGMQKLVLNTLRQRFGPVPQVVRQRIREISSSSELTRLNQRILASNSLRETGLL